MPTRLPLRRAVLLATALSGVAAVLPAAAQDHPAASPAAGTTGQSPLSGNSTPSEVTSGTTADQAEKIQVKVARRLIRERDAPSAVTELGAKQIAQAGVQGSPATLLRQAPSVYVYQQSIGNNEPVLTIRGVRGLEVAQTLDGVPTQDLLYGGTGGFLQNVIGGRFDLDQISGVTLYPGVAYPDENTFGTIGGTIAYASLRPSPDRFVEVTGSVGSFGTYNEGITLNTGRIDGFLGSGYDAPSLLLKYSNLQTQGFVDYTPARYNDFLAAFDKPYNGGLSKFEATVLYNTGNGYVTDEPIPSGYTAVNGPFANYSPDQQYFKQQNDYLSVILRNDTYVNDWLTAGITAFYLESESTSQSYENINDFGTEFSPGAVAVYGENPFSQTPAGFGEQGFYGTGNIFTEPPFYSYDGISRFPSGTAACPASVTARFAAAGDVSPCGYNAELTYDRNDTYGVQPRVTITPNEIFGISNTIKMGALLAKETAPQDQAYAWGTPDIPTSPENLISGGGGGTYRSIYQVYAQDKIDFLRNTLHITPGLTFEGTNSGYEGNAVFGGAVPANVQNSPYCQSGNPCLIGDFQSKKWDRNLLPFVNVAYDFDRVLPTLRGLTAYGSFGESALYAPVSDFSPNLLGTVPYASIVHMYEGGMKYNTSRLALSADYFYQKVDRDFGFFQYQSGPLAGDELYTNNGQREFKGVEFNAIWQLTPRWQLFWNGSHVLAKYLQTTVGNVSVQEDQFGIVRKGTPVTGVPDFISTFGADYDHKNWWHEGDEFHARLSGTYTGHQNTSYDLSGYENVGQIDGISYGNPAYYGLVSGSTTYDPQGGIAPFVVFNLDLNYQMPVQAIGIPYLKKLDFDLNILNLFDERYLQYKFRQVSPTACSGNAAAPYQSAPLTNYSCTPEFADGLPGEPFAATFTVTARF